MKEKGGVSFSIHQRPLEGSATNLMKAEVVFRNVSMEAFRLFGLEFHKQIHDAKGIAEFEILDRHPDGQPKTMYILGSKVPFIS